MDLIEIEVGTTPTPELLVRLMHQFNDQVAQTEARLQVEESGASIAKMQGYLAGQRKYGTLLMAAGYDFDYRRDTEREQPWVDDDDRPDFDDLKYIHLQHQELTISEEYKKLQDLVQQEVEQKKDFLFYQSDKSRDMPWCKGWYSAMVQIENWLTTLENSFELGKRIKAQELPFDEDDQD